MCSSSDWGACSNVRISTSKVCADGREAHAGVASWLTFYDAMRPHQALANRMPMEVWHEGTAARLDNATALPTRPKQQKQCCSQRDINRSERPRIQLKDWFSLGRSVHVAPLLKSRHRVFRRAPNLQSRPLGAS
jgi:hypothetical protein